MFRSNTRKRRLETSEFVGHYYQPGKVNIELGVFDTDRGMIRPSKFVRDS